jgi:hypothetical protein
VGRRVCRQLAALLSVAIFAFDSALAEEPTPQPGAPPVAGSPDPSQGSTWDSVAGYGAKAFDVFPIRLLSTCATIVGFGAFIVSVPLVAPGGQLEAIRGSWDYFVMGPVDYTFVRPLGDF